MENRHIDTNLSRNLDTAQLIVERMEEDGQPELAVASAVANFLFMIHPHIPLEIESDYRICLPLGRGWGTELYEGENHWDGSGPTISALDRIDLHRDYGQSWGVEGDDE